MTDAKFIKEGIGAATSGKTGNDARRRSPTILLAEDEPDIRYLVTLALQRAGYRVIAVGDGEAAVQTFAERGNEVDFVLFDLIMPQKNGWKAYCEIARMRPGIPHLFMSGFMGNVLQGEQLGDKGDAPVMRKPFKLMTLLSKLEFLLR